MDALAVRVGGSVGAGGGECAGGGGGRDGGSGDRIGRDGGSGKLDQQVTLRPAGTCSMCVNWR